MLHLRRRWTHAQAGIDLRQAELRSPGFLVVRQVFRHAPCEATARAPSGWATAILLLGGTAEGRSDQGVVKLSSDGTLVTSPSWVSMTISADAEMVRAFWRSTDVGPMDRRTLGAAQLSAARTLVQALEGPDAPTAETRQALSLLTTDVVPSTVVERGIAHQPTAEMVLMARSIERLSVRLHERPSIRDLARELGMDEKRASELAVLYFRRYHASVEGWREYLNGLRLDLGACAMRSGLLDTAEAARWLGFRASSSFCHAFQRAGLPKPSSFRTAAASRRTTSGANDPAW